MLLLATEVWRNHGGIQRYMRMLTTILAGSGQRISILTLLDGDEHRPTSVPAICCRGNKWRYCVEAFREAGSGVAQLAIAGHVALLPLVWALWRIRLIERYALVLHGIEAWRRLPWLSRIAARNASVIVATTQYTAREFCFHNSLEKANFTVIPLACEFRLSPVHRRTLDAPLRILSVTRLSKSDAYKGVDTLLQGIRRALDAGLKVTLDLVGDGSDRNRLDDLARDLKISSFVRFHGAVSDQQLENLLLRSHVFAMPSKMEGFGIVFLEAMAAGLPCIGSNHGGTPEVVEHYESGFLIEYGDVDQLVFYFRMLAESPGLYEAMSIAAHRRATGTLSFGAMTYSWNRLGERLKTSRTAAETPADIKAPCR